MDYSSGSNIDWKEDMLKKFTNMRKSRKDILRGVELKRAINDRKLDCLTSKSFDEVCYAYSNNAAKEYCFINKMSFQKYLACSIGYEERIRDAYNKIKKMVEEGVISDFKEYYNDQIFDLVRKNEDPLQRLSDIQKVKLTDILSKKFIKQIQNDNICN